MNWIWQSIQYHTCFNCRHTILVPISDLLTSEFSQYNTPHVPYDNRPSWFFLVSTLLWVKGDYQSIQYHSHTTCRHTMFVPLGDLVPSEWSRSDSEFRQYNTSHPPHVTRHVGSSMLMLFNSNASRAISSPLSGGTQCLARTRGELQWENKNNNNNNTSNLKNKYCTRHRLRPSIIQQSPKCRIRKALDGLT